MSNNSIFQNPKSGSIKLSGDFEIVDETGEVLRNVTDPKLCGCGLSQDKPLCDKSHAKYVSIVTQMLADASSAAKAITPVGVWGRRAVEIRQRALDNRIANGEKLTGIKFGGALIKSESENKSYAGIFGFLTDAMQVKGALKLSTLIAPMAEAEVVFKLGKDLDREISLAEAPEYVSELAPGIEIFDCRYGAIDPYVEDAIADNACAGAYIFGEWKAANSVDLVTSEISILVDGVLKQNVPSSAIAGNPWQAVVNASKKLAEVGFKLPAGSIVFSGSATNGIAMQPGKYCVEISGLGEVKLEAIN